MPPYVQRKIHNAATRQAAPQRPRTRSASGLRIEEVPPGERHLYVLEGRVPDGEMRQDGGQVPGEGGQGRDGDVRFGGRHEDDRRNIAAPGTDTAGDDDAESGSGAPGYPMRRRIAFQDFVIRKLSSMSAIMAANWFTGGAPFGGSARSAAPSSADSCIFSPDFLL